MPRILESLPLNEMFNQSKRNKGAAFAAPLFLVVRDYCALLACSAVAMGKKRRNGSCSNGMNPWCL